MNREQMKAEASASADGARFQFGVDNYKRSQFRGTWIELWDWYIDTNDTYTEYPRHMFASILMSEAHRPAGHDGDGTEGA